MAEYRVLRRHDGDKEYHAGDTRTADPAVVKHLIALGVLELEGKAEAAKEAAAKEAAAREAAAKEAAAREAAAKEAAAKEEGE